MTKFVRLIDRRGAWVAAPAYRPAQSKTTSRPMRHWNVMIEYEIGTYPAVKKSFNTMGCMHCEQPSCMACDAVGAKAITRTSSAWCWWITKVHRRCGYCAAVSAYGVPQLNKIKSLAPGKGALGSEAIAVANRHAISQNQDGRRDCAFCAHKLEQAVADSKVDRIGIDQAYHAVHQPSGHCPVQARTFGDLVDPNNDVSKKIQATGADCS